MFLLLNGILFFKLVIKVYFKKSFLKPWFKNVTLNRFPASEALT